MLTRREFLKLGGAITAVVALPFSKHLSLIRDTQGPRTIFVSGDGLDSNDGLSCEKPKRTISEALRSVTSPQDTVIVRGGYYTEHRSPFVDCRLIMSGAHLCVESGGCCLDLGPNSHHSLIANSHFEYAGA